MEARPTSVFRSFLTRVFKPRGAPAGQDQESANHGAQHQAALNELLGLREEIITVSKSIERRKRLLEEMQAARFEFEAETRILFLEEKALLMMLIRTYCERVEDSEREFVKEDRSYDPESRPRIWTGEAPQHRSMTARKEGGTIAGSATISGGEAASDLHSSTSVEDSVEKRRRKDLKEELLCFHSPLQEPQEQLLKERRVASSYSWLEEFQDESVEYLSRLSKAFEESLSLQYSSQFQQLEGNLLAERQNFQNILSQSLVASEKGKHFPDSENKRCLTNPDETTRIDKHDSTEKLSSDQNETGCGQKPSVTDSIATHEAMLVEQARVSESAEMRLERLREAAQNLWEKAASPPVVHPLHSASQDSLLIPAILPSKDSLFVIVRSQTGPDQNSAHFHNNNILNN